MPWTATLWPFTLIRPASIMSSQTRRGPDPGAGQPLLQPLPLPVVVGLRLFAVARVDGGELHVLRPAVAGCRGRLVVGRRGVHRCQSPTALSRAAETGRFRLDPG